MTAKRRRRFNPRDPEGVRDRKEVELELLAELPVASSREQGDHSWASSRRSGDTDGSPRFEREVVPAASAPEPERDDTGLDPTAKAMEEMAKHGKGGLVVRLT